MTRVDTSKPGSFGSRVWRLIYPPVSALLFGLYPVLYFYHKNVSLVLFSSFWRILVIYLVLILLVYLICLLLTRRNAIKAANAASVFLLFFNTYGIFYRFLLEKDLVAARHYTLLPLYIFIAIYLAWGVTRLKKRDSLTVWRATALIFGVFTVVGIIGIIPVEVEKSRRQQAQYVPEEIVNPASSENYPDIYYLIFDEFTGLKAMREYWKAPEVEPFKAYLKDKGFYVIEDSHGTSTATLHQMSIRLNYTQYPDLKNKEEEYYELIASNKVMSYLKSKGYTTVVFDEVSWLYPTMPTIHADYLYELDPSDNSDFGMIFDDFGVLITDNTMFYALSQYYQLEDFGYRPHRNMILSTVERVGNMQDVASPKFIYSHLMIPHRPYLFDAQGNAVDSEFYRNWDYYQGYWVYATGIIEQMVENILADADPQNPPVIILQSDHGARLHRDGYTFDYQSNILYAVYMPGFDTSTLSQDENPVNTFPLIFNHYFGENIMLR